MVDSFVQAIDAVADIVVILVATGGAIAVAVSKFRMAWRDHVQPIFIRFGVPIALVLMLVLGGTILGVLEQRTGFGDWTDVTINTIYEAPSDGFLAAYSGGDLEKIGRFWLETGASRSELDAVADRPTDAGLYTRTRATKYDGAVTPVRRGHYYRVRLRSGNPESIVAYWLPLGK